MKGLVLSLFPGIGLLDRAFEEAGFCVVRGPDLLWGGDVKTFHPPAWKFDGVIGGPPCQAHSEFTALNKSNWRTIAPDLVPEFVRCVDEARPHWWLMENTPRVPTIDVPGYVNRLVVIQNRHLGEEQSRRRKFQFGTAAGLELRIQHAALVTIDWQPACLATEGSRGFLQWQKGRSRSARHTRRSFNRFLELQGLPPEFLSDAPFTIEGKYRVVGNGVPLAMGRAVAAAVVRALEC